MRMGENLNLSHGGCESDLEAPPIASTGDVEVLGGPETVSL